MTNVLQRRMWWIIAFAIFWPVIGEITAGFITWMSVGETDFIFSSMDVLRRFIPPSVVSGFFLGWLVFALLDRAQTTAARILIVLSCLISAPISDRVTLLAAFVQVWYYLPFRISYFANHVLSMILMACSGFAFGAIVILAGFGLARALNVAFKSLVHRPASRQRNRLSDSAPMTPAIRVPPVIVVGATRYPSRMRTRRSRPIPRRPDVAIMPVPESVDPHVTRPRCIANGPVDSWARWRRPNGVVRSTRGAPCQRKHSQRRHQPKCSFHSVS